MRRGYFISFEGGEGLGKSTQIQLLAQALKKQGIATFVTREPGGTPVGEKLRKILKQEPCHPLTEIFVLEASRAEHVYSKILPALKRGFVVISDRFQESSLVYQGICGGLGLPLVHRLNKIATAGLKPDKIILLDGKQQRLGAKSKRDKFDQAGARFHRQIRLGFLKVARQNSRVKVIDADQDRLTVHRQIMATLTPLLKAKPRR